MFYFDANREDRLFATFFADLNSEGKKIKALRDAVGDAATASDMAVRIIVHVLMSSPCGLLCSFLYAQVLHTETIVVMLVAATGGCVGV